MSLRLFDSHSHLDAPEFDPDRSQVLARARINGVDEQLVPAVDRAGWPALKQLCAGESGLYPAYGLHPMYLDQHQPAHLAELRLWITQEKPPAIGECGLDFFVEGLDAQAQRLYFNGQLELAREFDLPLVIHARRSVEEVILSLRKIGGLRGIVHSYSGSEEQARLLVDMGFLLGIGGPVTYERARRLQRLARDLPLDALVLETDAPDQPGAGHRGQRNEPAHLVEVLAAVSRLRDCDEFTLAEATRSNMRRLLRLPEA
jgi:TatD DNase family protein